jgi:hypothetical protein
VATRFYLRNIVVNPTATTMYSMQAAQGAADATGVVNTAASGTNIPWTRTAGGTVLEFVSGRAPVGGFTLAGTVSAHISALESNMSANCGGRLHLYKRAANGTETEINGSPWDDGAELNPTTAASRDWTGTPTPSSVAFAQGDRLVARYYITAAGGTMASGYTCTIQYNGGANFDSYVEITETVAFEDFYNGGFAAASVVSATTVRVKAYDGATAAVSGVASPIVKVKEVVSVTAASSGVTASYLKASSFSYSGEVAAASTESAAYVKVKAVPGSVAATSTESAAPVKVKVVAGDCAAQSEVSSTRAWTRAAAGVIAGQSGESAEAARVKAATGATAAVSGIPGIYEFAPASGATTYTYSGTLTLQASVSGSILKIKASAGLVAAASTTLGQSYYSHSYAYAAGTIQSLSGVPGGSQFWILVIEGAGGLAATVGAPGGLAVSTNTVSGSALDGNT